MSNEVTLEQFNNYLKRKDYCLKHWGMPSLELFLTPNLPGTYDLKCVKNDVNLFESSDNFCFQIHYDPTQRLIGLFVKVNARGWFLDTIDLFEETGILLYTFQMVKESLDMMKIIYEREFYA